MSWIRTRVSEGRSPRPEGGGDTVEMETPAAEATSAIDAPLRALSIPIPSRPFFRKKGAAATEDWDPRGRGETTMSKLHFAMATGASGGDRVTTHDLGASESVPLPSNTRPAPPAELRTPVS